MGLDAVISTAIVVVVLLGAYLSWIISRLDRLAARSEAARSALDAQLVRRAALATVLAEATGDAELSRVAARALAAAPAEREDAENALSRALRAVCTSPERSADLASAAVRVGLARQFHNDAVRDLRALLGNRLLRLTSITRRRPAPVFFEFDDAASPRVSVPSEPLPGA